MNKCYYRIIWENYPSDKTPLNEQNLNKIDAATDEIDNRIISLDSTKFDKSEAQLLVKYIEYDEDTGIFTITHYNGASYTIDTLLEKLAINFDYDYQTQKLIIHLSDGTIKYVDLSALLTQYEFLNSDTIAFTVDNSGKVTANVKDGSIQEKHLRPDYLADIKIESAKAAASATTAGEKAAESMNSAALSKSWAVGGAGTRNGEDTDNAKYYSEQSAAKLEELRSSGVTGVKGDSETFYRHGEVNIAKADIGLENVGNFKAVSTVASQGLSDAEKANARDNISTYSKAKIDSKVIYLGSLNRLDDDLDNIAAEYDVPDSKPYIFSNDPVAGDFYLQNGTVRIVIGYSHYNHLYGAQLSLGTDSIKIRTKYNGVWSDWKRASDGGNAETANQVNGTYTGNGGQQPPSFVESGKIRFAMWDAFKGITNPSGEWLDVILMDSYTGGNVPYVTGIGVTKNNGNPRMFIANGVKGGTGNWSHQVEVITSGNIGSQSVASATNADTVDGIHVKVVSALPADAASHPDTLYIIPE